MVYENSNKIISREYKNQLLAAISINLITFSHGIATGWISPVLPVLQSNQSPLETGAITLNEASWIGALVCVGGLIGNSIFGLLVNLLGRKIALYLLAIPHLCLWITIFFSTNVIHLYVARLFGGTTGGGIYVTLPIFISEISDNNIRGTLGSLVLLVLNCGILIGYILSSYLPYYLMPQIIIGLPIIYIILVSLFPETPQYLLQHNQEEKAEKSFRFYRNFNGEEKNEIQKFNEMFSDLKKNINGSNILEKKTNQVTIKDFFKPTALKGIFIGYTLMFLNQFSGSFAIVNYASNIFNESGSNFNSNVSTIIIGVIQIVGTYISTVLVDKTGRKILLAISSCGTSLGLITLGLHSYFWKDYGLDWLPITSLSFAVFLACLGIIPLPFVVLIEVLPRKIRSICTTICMCTTSVTGFILLKIFPILMDKFALHGVMWLCGGSCLAGTFFIIFFVPETKGKCIDSDEENK